MVTEKQFRAVYEEIRKEYKFPPTDLNFHSNSKLPFFDIIVIGVNYFIVEFFFFRRHI